ncbi:MAG: nucleotide exchange factor GrpE [Gammaproteobacteria bacterium]
MTEDPEHKTEAQDENAPYAADSPEAEARSELETLRAEAAEHRERALRLAAEMENVRRRSARELETTRRFALERFAAELLPAIDSLELALEAAEAVPEGLAMTLKLLRDILARHHIEAVTPAVGDVFDPELHEAMAAQLSVEVAPDRILQVVQKGYRLHDRLLRPARVIVARTPDAAPPVDA